MDIYNLKAEIFLRNVALNTEILIKDGVFEDLIYYIGTVNDYLSSDLRNRDFTITVISLRENILIIEVING